MAGSTVASIEQGQNDSTGANIRTVYAKVVPIYAIYRTPERVMIQYADDPALGSEQRQSVAPISGVRGEINGMLDELRASADLRKHARADIIDRRVADALYLLLQGYADTAAASLAAIKEELAQERASWARFQYLFWAVGATVLAILVTIFVTSDLYERIFTTKLSPTENTLWLAAGAGAVGALFSIAIAIRKREIKAELIARDNIADAVLRILVAVIAAPLLISLMKSGVAALTIGGASLSRTEGDPLLVVIAGFLAGFIERLLPDLLEATALVKPPAGAAPAAAGARAGTAPANEINPRGMAAVAPAAAAAAATEAIEEDGDKHADECISEVDIDEDELTQDVELPEATGGVEAPPVKLTEG